MRMLLLALLIAAPEREPIGVVASLDMLPQLSSVLERATHLRPIEVDGSELLSRCGSQLRCVSRARPAEARLLLVVERPQGRLTALLLDGAAAEHLGPEDDEASLIFARAEIAEGEHAVERLIIEGLSPALDDLDLMRDDPVLITETVQAPPPPDRSHAIMRHTLAWSANVVGTIGLAMVLSRLVADSDCFIGDHGCTPLGLASTEGFNPAYLGYSFVTMGIVTSLTTWLARKDIAPWWQPIIGAVTGFVTFSILVVLDNTGVFEPKREALFLAATGG